MKQKQFDDLLAYRMLNKINKQLVEAQTKSTEPEVSALINRTFQDVTFLYDVLHIREVDVININ